ETWTRPSTPSMTETNAPNGTVLVTVPSTTSPTSYSREKTSHGSSRVSRMESEMRSRSRSTSSTLTVTSSPTLTTSDGWLTCCQDSSETWTSPSMPPRSTKAPNATTDETVPVRISP